MHIDYTPEQKALRDRLRGYFKELMVPELVAEIAASGEGGGPLYHKALRRMGSDGLLGVGWPKEYGGQGMTPIEQFIFSDEVQRAGFPLPFLTINSVGPTIMQYGSDEQRNEYLPKILRGELHFAIGYSEASAGTDLASLTTKAVREGDEYVINGSKVFTSLANYSDYIWLAARTNPDAPKHQGISIFMVPTSAPGYKCTPIHTVGSIRTNATYFEDVRVPANHLIGSEHGGWWLIVNQLNHERVALCAVGPSQRILEEVTQWARSTRRPDGSRLIDEPWVQLKLARVRARVEVLKLLNWRQAWCLTQGALNFADASAVKVYGTEFYIDCYRDMLEVVGHRGMVRRGSPQVVARGLLEMLQRAMLVLTFGGGTNEIQRDIIAKAGLGMRIEIRS